MYRLFFGFVLFFTISLNSFAQNLQVNYELQGLVLIWGCDYDASINRISINITNITGGSGTYYVTPFGQGSVSSNVVTSGNGFTYYFTELDQQTNGIGFEISDGNGNFYYLDPDVATQLYIFPFSTCLPSYCPNVINQTSALDVTSLIYQADNSLISESTIKSGRDVIYKAGSYILLNSGFEVLPNGELEILIESCN